ncbi:putative transposable element-related protein [Cucumis melo var. makuwa]|uniref:Transposable element-related protein n=1 Tax=Cucumis melo var. makuwa TaxID=1194695 RepID=A0A5A7SPP9_CUCMM|nr:putative transposable element-related protein [Cucumis melo var. makuwa]TYK07496.1 putative transposable element-related protein [Cucumis melo var. makuwa]
MPGRPNMNNVAERRNRTLKDMERSIISHSSLLESLCREALKTATYILNRVPSKAVAKPLMSRGKERSRVLGILTLEVVQLRYFEMKDIRDAFFVLGIGILRDCSQGQCLKTTLEIKEMQKVPYASVIGSLMYAQIYMHPDIVFIVGVLDRYLSNSRMDHLKAVKWVMRFAKPSRVRSKSPATPHLQLLTLRRAITHLMDLFMWADLMLSTEFMGFLEEFRICLSLYEDHNWAFSYNLVRSPNAATHRLQSSSSFQFNVSLQPPHVASFVHGSGSPTVVRTPPILLPCRSTPYLHLRFRSVSPSALPISTSYPANATAVTVRHRRASPPLAIHRVEAEPIVELLQAAKRQCRRVPEDPSLVVDSLGMDSIKGHSQVSGKGFLTTGPRIEAGNVVTHKGLYVSSVTASCSLCSMMCNELLTDRHRCPDVLCIVVMLVGYVVNWNCMSMDYKVLMLGCGVMVSLIYGVVYLTDMCKGTARGKPTRGKKDA